ncbi:MAG: DUF2490 domain-containing protein [Cyclobacteriaceae bacterium]|nr:DUF2490 domain-containing protein [Cyclobacteriaceae bacterium]
MNTAFYLKSYIVRQIHNKKSKEVNSKIPIAMHSGHSDIRKNFFPRRSLLLLMCSLLFMVDSALSQTKEFENREMTWLGYFNQTRFTNKSGLWVDLHLRLNDQFVNEVHATLARVGYIYYFTDQARLTVGYAHQTQYGHENNPTVQEHRPWQQIQWFEKKSWFTMMQWIRLEERFREEVSNGQVTGDYTFNYRIRYNMSFSIPLTQKQMGPKTPFIFMNNEVFINFGKNIVNNYFDQNRAFVGLGYQFTQHLNAHLGYMYIFQQLPAGNEYINTHAIRLFVFHNLDFRKKE